MDTQTKNVIKRLLEFLGWLILAAIVASGLIPLALEWLFFAPPKQEIGLWR